MIFVLLGVNAGVVGVTIYAAVTDRSFAVEPEYYRRALEWNQTARQRERNAALGWAVEVASLEPRVAGLRVAVRVRERHGAPVSGAQVAVLAFAESRAGRRYEATLAEGEAGAYTGDLPVAEPAGGLWLVRVAVSRGGDLYTAEVARPLDGLPSAGGAVP
jgi:nitrogen fixation protein FixH